MNAIAMSVAHRYALAISSPYNAPYNGVYNAPQEVYMGFESVLVKVLLVGAFILGLILINPTNIKKEEKEINGRAADRQRRRRCGAEGKLSWTAQT